MSWEVPCRTLARAGELLQECGGDVRIQMRTNLTLNDEIRISNASSFEIVGGNLSPYNLTYVKCEGGAGLILDSIHNFRILNVALVNCTANFSKNYRIYRFAVLIKSSSNFIFKNVRFENSSTTALVLINNTQQVTLENTSFIRNHPKRRRYDLKMVSYPGAVSIQQNLGSNDEAVHFRISNSIFYYNQSPIVSTVVKNYTNFIDRGFGGAMFIEFGGGTSNSSLIIEDSRFTYNTAARGGAIYAYYTNSAWNNSIRIFNTEFKGNNADISGGGLNLGCTSAVKNVFEVAHSNFISNFALYGAGLTMFSAFGNSELASTNFTISNSTW